MGPDPKLAHEVALTPAPQFAELAHSVPDDSFVMPLHKSFTLSPQLRDAASFLHFTSSMSGLCLNCVRGSQSGNSRHWEARRKFPEGDLLICQIL